MTKTDRKKSRHKKAVGAYALAMLGCVLGLFFCTVKSPQAQSAGYLAAAREAMERRDDGLAVRAAFEAARLNPASADAWTVLEGLLQRNGHKEAAYQAQAIVVRLQQKPASDMPLYAMPAELRLSLLTLAAGEAR